MLPLFNHRRMSFRERRCSDRLSATTGAEIAAVPQFAFDYLGTISVAPRILVGWDDVPLQLRPACLGRCPRVAVENSERRITQSSITNLARQNHGNAGTTCENVYTEDLQSSPRAVRATAAPVNSETAAEQ